MRRILTVEMDEETQHVEVIINQASPAEVYIVWLGIARALIKESMRANISGEWIREKFIKDIDGITQDAEGADHGKIE